MIILSDGKPYDVIVNRPNARNPQPYQGKYAVRDTGFEVRKLRIWEYVLGVFAGEEKDLATEKKIFGKDFAYIREITNPLITMQHHPENTTPVFHLFVITVPDHDDFVKYMADNDVECNMHYPVPCHLQKAYANLGYKPGDCPNAEYLAAHCVTLPLFPEMREDEIRRVIELCNAYRQ